MLDDITPIQAERFWTKVRRGRPAVCWEWQAATNAAGYGIYRIGRGRKGSYCHLAHRIAYFLTHGSIPAEKPFILHLCDNRKCCNPAHLWAGTKLDNAIDREAKGRGGNHRGTANGNSRLTESEVLAIRAAYTGVRGQQRRLAEQYNVTPAMIRFIVNRWNWKHLSPSFSHDELHACKSETGAL